MKKQTILMTLMALDVGGAETHVIELSKKLKAQGYKVLIASGGGYYENILKELSIPHYKVTFSKTPWGIMKAKKQLKKIILDEKVDIVHAHARMPIYVCGRLHESMGSFKYVTTIHFNYVNKNWLMKKMSLYSENTIAVSEDLKNYGVSEYHLKPENIKVIFNGIDIENFQKKAKEHVIKCELKTGDCYPVLVYVARMDIGRTEILNQVFNVIKKLSLTYPNLRLLVVGGGTAFDSMNEGAQKANEAMGRESIKVLGPRQDIPSLLNVSDVTLGVARCALEGMTLKKPVLLMSVDGFPGFLSEATLEANQKANFTGRGFPKATEEKIEEALRYFFNLSKEEQTAIADYGYEIVQKDYSLDKMVEEHMVFYDQLFK